MTVVNIVRVSHSTLPIQKKWLWDLSVRCLLPIPLVQQLKKAHVLLNIAVAEAWQCLVRTV